MDEHPPEGLTDGERWARQELAALRSAGYVPAAWRRFLAASLRRARERRDERPELARQARAWIAIGAAAWAGAAAAGAQPFRRRTRSGLGWWALTGLMLDWHLGMVETTGGGPRALGPADACTLLRAWLTPAAADDPSAPICAVAAITDVLDGALARAGEPTRIGRDLEGLVDTAFALAALRGATGRGRLGGPVAAVEAARLSAGTLYASAAYFRTAEPPDTRLTGSARMASPVRAAGLIAAGLGRRRAAGALVAASSAVSLAATTRAALAPRARMSRA